MTHDADIDGRCESCGELVGFFGTHADSDCVAHFRERLRDATALLEECFDSAERSVRKKIESFLKEK